MPKVTVRRNAESECRQLRCLCALPLRARHYHALGINGETVPAGEKVVSLFEPHTDILVKGGRATTYGHKINLTTGRSGLVLDAVVEQGNPAGYAGESRWRRGFRPDLVVEI